MTSDGEVAGNAETKKRKAAEGEGEEDGGKAAIHLPHHSEEEETGMAEGSDSIPNPNPNPNPSFDLGLEEYYDWSCYKDADIMQQHSAIKEEALKVPYVGEKEPISALAAEFQSGNPILQEKIKLLGEQYVALRRTRGDGNCFFRSFMFSYLEHILETQDKVEVDRIIESIRQCKKTLLNLGYSEFTFEDFFSMFVELLEGVLQGKEDSISRDDLLLRCRDQMISDYVVMFFRFITTGEIRRRAEFFEPFIAGLTNTTVDKFCKSSVEPMGEESDHVHITALSDAVGVPIRVVYLDRSLSDTTGGLSINHHDFIPSLDGSSSTSEATDSAPEPFVKLLYRPGHYEILYSK